MMDKPSHFFIRRHGKEWILINRKGKRENHAHFHNKGNCHLLVRLICDGIVPDKGWLRRRGLRVSLDEKYREKLQLCESTS